jgi:X-Pro dipeptidyl-peptidase
MRLGASISRPRGTLNAAALALAALALAPLATPTARAQQPARAQEPGRAAPVFRDGQPQVVPAFADSAAWIREEVWVETGFDSDGDGRPDRVHVAIVRPRQTATEGLKVPVVYESSPYYSGTSGPRDFLWDVRQEVDGPPPPRASQPAVEQRVRPGISNSHVGDWVPRGFAVVHSEAPGTGLSQGCPTVGGPTEALAPKAVVDWLNGRARAFTTPTGNEEVAATWSTGKVGMTGTSYNGTLAVAAASTGVDGLEAIIPVAPNNSYYRYYRANGLVVHPGGWLGEDIDFLYDYINSGDPARRAYCNATIRVELMARGMDRKTGDYNDFWATRDLLTELGDLKAATFMAHAFNDWNVKPEHSILAVEAIRARGVPVKYYFHQGGHGGPPPLELMNRWFTRYLYGVENGIEQAPKAWIVREDDPRDQPTPYADYPNPAAVPVRLGLSAGEPGPNGQNGVGGLGHVAAATGSATGQGRAASRGRATAPRTETFVDNVSFAGAALASAAHSPHRLIYATSALAEPLHISGTPRVTIRLAANKSAVNLSVWLVALPWTGSRKLTDDLITRGWADPRNRDSLREQKPLIPGQFVDVTFDLQPDDQVIPAGKRIGLMLFSSDRDFTLWPEPGATLTVDLDGTILELPVGGGEAALRRALAPKGAATP